MNGRKQALQNIIDDFDKETAVDLMGGRIDELTRALADLSARIYLQHANTGLPWLEEWQRICDEAIHQGLQRDKP